MSYRYWMSTMVWWWHSTPLVRRLIPSGKVPRRMWLSSECSCHSRFTYSSQSSQEGFNRSTYRRRIDHFYEYLNPKYWHMLVHKVDGKHSASYSDLVLAVQKLERWAKARDFLFPKTTTTGGSNVTQWQTLGNLFLSRKQRVIIPSLLDLS